MNNHVLIFIRPGSAALLLATVFSLKFFWRILKNISYGLRGANNGTKTVLLVITVILSLWASQTQETWLPAAYAKLGKISLSSFNPIDYEKIPSNQKTAGGRDDLLDVSEAKERATTSVNNEKVDDRTFGQVIDDFFYVDPERKEECKAAFDYVNQLRAKEGRKAIVWDDRIYNLGILRTKDMYDRKYFDHVDPDGKCAKDFQAQFGIQGVLAENAGAQMSSPGEYTQDVNVMQQVNNWMTSRGHRYNLLYEDHTAGAIACYYGACVFLGLQPGPYGLGAGPCSTGDEGLAYWDSVGTQPGET